MLTFKGKIGDRVATFDSGALATVIDIHEPKPDSHGSERDVLVKFDGSLGESWLDAGDLSWPHDDEGPQPFTEADWQGMSGAETWPSGAQPLVRYGLNWFGVADPYGVELYRHCGMPEAQDQPTIRIEMQVPNQQIARLLLAAFPNELDWKAESERDYSHNEFF